LASNLNQHKLLSHLSDGSRCPCGDDVEDNFHYFYVCPLFICQRILLFTQLRDLADFLNIDVPLKGPPDLSFDDNVLIMNSVHTFICGTKRLDLILIFFNLILCYLLWIFFNLLLKMFKQIYIYNYVYMCICMNMPSYVPIYTCTYVSLIYRRIY
jgi:hypothetical protein